MYRAYCQKGRFGKLLEKVPHSCRKESAAEARSLAMHVKGVEAGQHEPRLMPAPGLDLW